MGLLKTIKNYVKKTIKLEEKEPKLKNWYSEDYDMKYFINHFKKKLRVENTDFFYDISWMYIIKSSFKEKDLKNFQKILLTFYKTNKDLIYDEKYYLEMFDLKRSFILAYLLGFLNLEEEELPKVFSIRLTFRFELIEFNTNFPYFNLLFYNKFKYVGLTPGLRFERENDINDIIKIRTYFLGKTKEVERFFNFAKLNKLKLGDSNLGNKTRILGLNYLDKIFKEYKWRNFINFFDTDKLNQRELNKFLTTYKSYEDKIISNYEAQNNKEPTPHFVKKL